MSHRFLIGSPAVAALLAVLVVVCTQPALATGWAVGGNGLVIRSTDGGQNWSSSSPTSSALNAVYFVSDNVGWAVGNSGVVLKTIDGGDNWSQTTPGTVSLNGVYFTGPNHGWIVGDGGKILRTTNGGTTWSTSTPTTSALYGVFFYTQSLGWAVGKSVVLRTTNGGDNWTSASPSPATLRDVHFTTQLLGRAVGNNGVVLSSSNGGVTWSSSTETPSDLYSIHFPTSLHGWAVGEAGIILNTVDGGESWTAQRAGSAILRSVHFIDSENGWAAGTNGTIARTVDGGENWNLTNPAAVPLNGVYFASIPAGVSVTVETDPPGRSFTVDGTGYTSAHTFHWEPGTPHTIATTSPQSGGTGTQYVWSSWSNGGAISQSVAPEASTTYTANFTKQYSLTMPAVPNGSVAPGNGWHDAGAAVSISATPNGGYAFNGWTGSGTGAYSGWSNPVTIHMNAPITETASFSTDVSVIVRSSPAGRSFVVDGTTYTAEQTFTWAVGSSHALDAPSPQGATSDTRQVFSRWSDDGSANHSVAPVSNTTYTVTYKTQYMLTTTSGTGGSVTPVTGWRDAGSNVTISASADSGYYFQSWSGSGSGAYSGTSNPKAITVNGPISQQAAFAAGTAPEFPAELTVLQNAPNPAISQTDLRYGLPVDSDVTIEVFDVAGRRVFEDQVRNVLRGWQTYRLDVAGSPLRSGVYFVRVTAAGTARTSNLIVLR